MNLSLSTMDLKKYVCKQLQNFFPDKYYFEGGDVDSAFDIALERTEYCFKHITLFHFTHEEQVWFNHLHSDQYSMFLYFLANSLWKQSENKPLCDKLIFLNKTLNGLFYSYKCDLPSIFLFSHPVGTVIGNAIFSDFLVVLQNVTINTSDSYGEMPKIGKGVVLSAGSMILGDSKIGNRCSIGANTIIRNKNIPNDSIVFTDENGVIGIKTNRKQFTAEKLFNIKIED